MHPYFEERSIPEPNTGCYLWLLSYSKDGYGRCDASGNSRRAHRRSYEAEHGVSLPVETQVLHRCDNPGCVNPDHLFLGTNADNMADKARKGRVRVYRGEDSNLAILTEQQARAILNEPGTHQAIADRFGVNRVTVTNIKSRRTWRCLDKAA